MAPDARFLKLKCASGQAPAVVAGACTHCWRQMPVWHGGRVELSLSCAGAAEGFWCAQQAWVPIFEPGIVRQRRHERNAVKMILCTVAEEKDASG